MKPTFCQLSTVFWLCSNILYGWSTQATAGLNDAKKPVIRVPPSDVFSTDGVLEFSCQADGIPKPVINWHDANSGHLVIDQTPTGGTTAGIHVNQHYGRLMVSNPIRDTIYSFYCNASNAVGWTISEPPAKGGLAYLESKFRQIPSDKTVPEGGRVLLECLPPKGMPSPKVYWLRQGNLNPIINDNAMLNNTDNYGKVVTPDGGLQIESASLSDSGLYVCVAANIAGKYQSPSARLHVEARVRFLETPKDIRVRQGSDVKFRCRVEGNRLVQWSRDQGRGLIDPSRVELSEEYLLLKDVQLADAGTYICTASGSIAAQAILTVETPPTFSRTPDDTTVYEGETAIFHCVTIGFPKPSIYWELPDKTPLFPSDQNEVMRLNKRFYLNKNGNLEIRNVQKSDAGRYQCTAHSSIDRIHSSASLQVLPRPTGNSIADVSSLHFDGSLVRSNFPLVPIIGLPPANQSRIVGDLVTLDCELGINRADVPNVPQPYISVSEYNDLPTNTDWTVTWHKTTSKTRGVSVLVDNSNQHDDQRYSVLPGGSLQIYDVQITDSGAYTCTARTVYQPHHQIARKPVILQSNWTAYLKVHPRGSAILSETSHTNPISPPQNVRPINVTDSTITLAWDPPHWPEVDNSVPDSQLLTSHPSVSYWVEFYRPDNMNEGWQTVEHNWQANVMKMGNLQPNTPYYFLIRPRLNSGRVGWASAPLGPVFTLPLYSQEATDQELSKPLRNKEMINAVKNLEIKNLRLQALTPQRAKVTWTVNENPEVLLLLSGYTIYYRKVSIMQCVTVNIDDRSSEMIGSPYNADDYCSLKLDDVYDRLQQLHTLRKTGTKYNPTENTIESLDVKARFSLDQQPYDTSQPLVYDSSGLIRDLHPFHCYEVNVKAYLAHNLLGKVEGRESVSRTILTFESFPSSPPDKVSARWISNHEIELSWNEPSAADWNGLLIGFAIYIYDETALFHDTFNVTFAERRTIIKGLTGPNAYLIQMAGVTCKGVGIRSQPLRLDPKFKQNGLGAGWAFDEQTGLPITALDSETRIIANASESMTSQPWFIGLIVSSLVLWCALIALIVCCCRHQRFTLQKNSAGTLIVNASNCGSNVGEPPECHLTKSAIKKAATANERRCDDSDLMKLEALMKPLLSKTDSEAAARVQNSYNLASPTDDPHAYGLYSVANGDFHWSNYPGADTIPNRTKLYRTAIPSGENVTGYQCTDLNTVVPSLVNIDVTHMPSGRFSGIVNSGAVNYVTNCSPILSTYLTYQPAIIPLSQSINEFHSHNLNREQQISYPVCTGNIGPFGPGGLPLVAPVARLTNHSAQFNHTNTSPMLDCLEPSSTSVTPYATASIAKTRQPAQPPNTIHHDGNVPNDGWDGVANDVSDRSETKQHSDNVSYSSSDGSTSYGSSHTSVKDRQRVSFMDDKCCKVGRTNNLHGPLLNNSNIMDNARKRGQNGASNDVRTVSSNNSKSESSSSNRTRLSDESNYLRQKNSYDPAYHMQMCSTNSLKYLHQRINKDGSIYSLIDETIPPPPASPPPPAPTHNVSGCGHKRVAETDSQLSSRVGLVNSKTGSNRGESAIYDTNADSAEDENESMSTSRDPSAHLPINAQFVKRSDYDQSQTPFCVQMVPDNSRNSTYAQVY